MLSPKLIGGFQAQGTDYLSCIIISTGIAARIARLRHRKTVQLYLRCTSRIRWRHLAQGSRRRVSGSSSVSRRTSSRDLTRCTIRESRRYLCHPEGPSASNSRRSAWGFTGSPREAADKAEFTAIDAFATRSTDERGFPGPAQPAGGGQVRCQLLFPFVGEQLTSRGLRSGVDAEGTQVSAMKRTGPSAPSRSQRSQSPKTRAPHPVHRNEPQRFAGTPATVSR